MSSEFPGAISVEAVRLGRVVWVAEALARSLGVVLGRRGAAGDGFAPDDSEVVDLAGRIRRHVETAQVLRARLPELREFPIPSLVIGDDLPSWVRLAGAIEASDPRAVAAVDRTATSALAEALEAVVAAASPVGSPALRRRVPPLVGELRAAAVSPADSTAASPDVVGPSADRDLVAELLAP